MHTSRLFSVLLLCHATLLASSAPAQEARPTAILDDAWEAKTLDPAALEKVLGETREALKGIAETEKDDSPAGIRRTYLRRRAGLLEELVGLLKRRAALEEEKRSRPAADAVKRAIEALVAEPPAAAPPADEVTTKGAEEKLEKLKTAQKAATEAEKETKRLAKRLEDAAALAPAVRKRAEEAETRLRNFEKELAGAQEEDTRAVIQERVRNARLDSRVAQETLAWLEEEQAAVKEAAPVAAQQLDLAQKRQKRLADEYRLYQEVLGQRLEEDRKAKEEALRRQQAAAAAANDPAERFLAAREAEVLKLEKELAELEKRKLALQEAAQKQKRLHDAEKQELESLENIVDKMGSSELAAVRLKAAFFRVGQRSRLLRTTLERDLSGEVFRLNARQIELTEELRTLEESWAEKIEAIAGALPERARDEFKQNAADRQERYEQALSKVRAALDDVAAEAQKLDAIQLDRLRTLEEEELFVQSRSLWIRDAAPLDLELLGKAGQEFQATVKWGRSVFTGATLKRLAEDLSPLRLLLRAVALLIVFPAVVLFIRRRIRRFHDRHVAGEGKRRRPFLVTTVELASGVLLPAYVYGAAWLLQSIEMQGSLNIVLGQTLRMIAVLVLVSSSTRTLVGRGGLATPFFGLKEDTARTIHRAVHLLVFAALFFLVPFGLLRQYPPFGHDALPRIAYTLFEACAIVALFMLMRPSSPVVRDTVGRPSRTNQIARFWGTLSKLAGLMFVAILAMDVLGYRFGAARLTASVLLSLATIVALMVLYRLLVPLVEDILRRRRRELTTAPGETPATTVYALGAQVRRFARVVFIAIGILLLILYWGIDANALKGLDEIALYTLSSTGDRPPEAITLADVLISLLTILLTVWILRYLPGLYEIVVFPRFQWDSGLRYAVLTISRYGIVFVGILIALSAIHLDLGRLGWLMAALGVGIGFGLQEIVSNFVSGIILLVERPIRVGDTVTIGSVSGEVTRINIRATTVLSWDRMEVVLPNKDLITKEVTNWTLADNTTRVTVPIGVEYGSDVDAVRKMLLELADQQPEILKDPKPQALFLRHGESSLDFEVRFFVPRLKYRLELTDRMNTLINRRLGEMGIGIPFPQRDLHIRSDFRVPPEANSTPDAKDDTASGTAPTDSPETRPGS